MLKENVLENILNSVAEDLKGSSGIGRYRSLANLISFITKCPENLEFSNTQYLRLWTKVTEGQPDIRLLGQTALGQIIRHYQKDLLGIP